MNITNNKTPKQILNNHAQNYLPSNYRWWADYIFHFSHVTNIASILNQGKLLSVNKANKLNSVDLNDNASAEVRDGTTKAVLDCVRFYFRPLTPTQFNNEGIRANSEFSRYNAHCPVPIFLLFDSDMLEDARVWFSEESLASHYDSHNIFQGGENLSSAPFNEIYHIGPFDNTIPNMIIKRRHAEVIVKDEFDLFYLKKIICRNRAEVETLKNLLHPTAFQKFSDLICVPEDVAIKSETIFFNEYLKIEKVELTKKLINIHFTKFCFNKRKLYLELHNNKGQIIGHFCKENLIIGVNHKFPISINNLLDNEQIVTSKIFLDNKLVYSNTFYLS